jgi:hypothetical protein
MDSLQALTAFLGHVLQPVLLWDGYVAVWKESEELKQCLKQREIQHRLSEGDEINGGSECVILKTSVTEGGMGRIN